MSIFISTACLNCGKVALVNIDTDTGLIDLICPKCKKPLHKLKPKDPEGKNKDDS